MRILPHHFLSSFDFDSYLLLGKQALPHVFDVMVFCLTTDPESAEQYRPNPLEP